MFGLLKYAKIIENKLSSVQSSNFRSLFRVSLALIHGSLSRCRYSSKRPTDCHRNGPLDACYVVSWFIFVMICQYYASVASQGFGTELRNQLMKKINQLSHKELNSFGTDTLITRITNDINQLQLALAMFIRLVIRTPF